MRLRRRGRISRRCGLDGLGKALWWIQSNSHDYACENTNENHAQEMFDVRTLLAVPTKSLAESVPMSCYLPIPAHCMPTPDPLNANCSKNSQHIHRIVDIAGFPSRYKLHSLARKPPQSRPQFLLRSLQLLLLPLTLTLPQLLNPQPSFI